MSDIVCFRGESPQDVKSGGFFFVRQDGTGAIMFTP